MLFRKIGITSYSILGLLLSIGMIFLCACSEENNQSKSIIDNDELKQYNVDFDEPLKVFYEDAGLLANFSYLYPEIKLELYKIYQNVDGEDTDIVYWAKKYGDPDIVLLNDWGHFDIESEYENGQVEDISEYVYTDATFSEFDYLPGTLDVLNNGKAIMGLPLSWYKKCLIVKASEVKESELSALSERYTGRELFEALLTEIKKEKYEEKFCWLDGLAFHDNLTELSPKVEGKFQIDEEMFKVLFEFGVRSSINSGVAREIFGDFRSQTHYEPALDPEVCPEGYLGTFLRGAPQVTAIYAKSVAAMDQDDVKLYWIPTIDSGEDYVGMVRDYAFIGKNSSRKQQAYEVIRMMMDMPVTIMTQPTGNVPEIYSSVNIERSLEMLEYFNSLEQELTIRAYDGTVFYTLDQQKLSEEDKDEIRGIISGISSLYLDYSLAKQNEMSESFHDYKELSIENGKIDYTMCYAEMLKYFVVDKTSEEIAEGSENYSTKKESADGGENTVEETNEVKKLKEKIRNTEVGETFLLGATEQDNNLENGIEPIEWVVLDKTESKIFVVSKKVLEYLTFSKWESMSGADGVMYMEPQNYFTWKLERNQQRAWLLNELYENGFTENEKLVILQTHNESPSWRDYDPEEGSNDYLYIPSKEDVENYMSDLSVRQAKMTVYVAEKAKKFIDDSNYIGWSLRTEGTSPKYSKQITANGEISEMYTNVANGVRPVMWLDIS